MFTVELTDAARRSYERADLPLARKLARCFQWLEHDPRRHPNIKALKGPLAGRWRFRVGDYRVIYRIDDARATVHVLLIEHRRQAYE